jgi:hypothetical protein
MLERLQGLPSGVEGVRAVGRVSAQDYEQVLEPLLDELERDRRRVRFLYRLGPEFEGFAPGGMWRDAEAGVRSLRSLDGCALVSDTGWIHDSARLIGVLLPCPLRVFDVADYEAAVHWLVSLPERGGLVHRLLPESGVIVVDITGAISARDLERLARSADPWIETHGTLEGLVIRVHERPGWDALSSFVRHARLTRDQRRRVKRVALVADSRLAGFVQRTVERLARVQTKSFGCDKLEDAIAWASGPNAHGTTPPLGAPATQDAVS